MQTRLFHQKWLQLNYVEKSSSRSGTSESLEPSKLLSLILADPTNATQSSAIIILLCTYTCNYKRSIMEY